MMIKTIKGIVFFGLIAIGIIVFRKLIYSHFELSGIFNFDFLIFEILVEFGLLVSTAFLTHLFIMKITKSNLGISLLKALIFSIVYGLIFLISSRIVLLSLGAEIGFQFDVYESFLTYLPRGFVQGILYLFVLFHFDQKSNTKIVEI